jgi:hypothetical protein
LFRFWPHKFQFVQALVRWLNLLLRVCANFRDPASQTAPPDWDTSTDESLNRRFFCQIDTGLATAFYSINPASSVL